MVLRPGSKKRYSVSTFNVLVQNTEPYTVDNTSLRFLVGHGFDFNKQISSGLLYTPGNDEEVGLGASSHLY